MHVCGLCGGRTHAATLSFEQDGVLCSAVDCTKFQARGPHIAVRIDLI